MVKKLFVEFIFSRRRAAPFTAFFAAFSAALATDAAPGPSSFASAEPADPA